MRKLFFIILLSALSAMSFAQEPDWFDVKNRMAFYPTNTYFYGFSMDELSSNADVEKGIEHVKAAARAEAASTVQVYVQSVKQDNTRSESYQTISKYVEEIYQQFSSNTTLTTKMEIPGLKVESYKKGNIVAAFAYVKKSDFSRKLEKQITIDISRIETKLDNIAELMDNGQKMEARTRLEPIIRDFLPIEQTQETLLAVNPNVDTEALQLDETRALQQRYFKMSASLKNGIYVALHCDAQLFDTKYEALSGTIKGDLASLGCTFTDNEAEADWIVTIRSKAKEYQKSTLGEHTTYYSYVDSYIEVRKVKTGQVIFEDNLSVKGGDTRSFVHAAQDGYMESANKLSTIIRQQISQ